MAQKNDAPLDLRTYLAKARGGTTKEYLRKHAVFSQGSPADAVFYLEKGKVKLTASPRAGRRRSSQSWGAGISLVKVASRGSRFAWPRRPR
jgi:CRP-like cAMP-binding protein